MTVTQERLQTTEFHVDLDLFEEWRQTVHDHTTVEPLEREMPYLAQELGSRAANVSVLTAADNDAGSFKWRGAFYGTYRAGQDGAETVVAASAGNHGMGVVAAANCFKMKSRLYLPSTTSPAVLKEFKRSVTARSVELNATAPNVDAAIELATLDALQDPSARLIPPFDSPATIAGQGTMADDILRFNPEVEQVVMAAGGGGGLAGMADRFTQLGRGDIRLMAAQAEGSNSLSRSMKKGEVKKAKNPNKRYRGAMVLKAGTYCIDQLSRYDNFTTTTVSNDDVDDVATLYAYQNEVLMRDSEDMYEPTTLLAFTALRYVDLSKNTVIIGSGKNQSPLELFKSSSRFHRSNPRLPYGPDSQK